MEKSIYLMVVMCFSLNLLTAQTDTIGNQIWETKNLNTEKFQNGDIIIHAKTNEEWTKAGEDGIPAWCYYNNDPANGAKYGKLYNWYAVNDPRGLSSNDWHIPSETEWVTLSTYLGGDKIAGSKMKSTNNWQANGNGTNESGFNGFPGGFRDFDGAFNNIGIEGYWWSTAKYGNYFAWSNNLNYAKSNAQMSFTDLGCGFSIRLVKEIPQQSVLSKLQGKWQNVEDEQSCFLIDGYIKKDYYNNKELDIVTFTLEESCPNEDSDYGFGSGKDFYMDEEGICFFISFIDSEYLTLVFMSRGNSNKYKRIEQ
jgi:uncharacterized protein (TIGR02145 family)